MYQIILVPVDSKATAPVFFKAKDSAEAAHKNIFDAQKGSLPAQILKVEDDYGAILTIDKDKISHVMFVDGEKQKELAMLMSQPKGMN